MYEQTVKEAYQLDEDKLFTLEDCGPYWAKCAYFYNEVKEKNLEELTPNQRNWMNKISDDYEEEYEKNFGG